MKTLYEKCQMFMSLSKVNMYLVTNSKQYESFISYNIPHFMMSTIDTTINDIYDLHASSHIGKSLFYRTTSNLCFLALYDTPTNTTVIVGPFTDGSLNTDTIKYIGYKMKLTNENVEILSYFINIIPMFDDNEIMNLVSIMKMIMSVELDSSQIIHINSPTTSQNAYEVNNKFEQYDFVKDNFEKEEKLMKIIEMGDLDALSKAFTLGMSIPARNPSDRLRDAKNLEITLNSISMRAALKGGLNPHLAHSMSHNFAILIEKQINYKVASNLAQDIVFEYTNAVHKYSLKNYSSLITESILYIRRHTTETLSLKDIALELNTSKEHLSRQFKKETQLTVSHYIHKIKIEESLTLISSKQYTISNIAYLFGFSNPAHYSATFKKIMGISPAYYQNKK